MRKGNILQIVLIIFYVFTLCLSLFYTNLVNVASITDDIDLLEKQRRLEVIMIYYYRNTLKNDFLSSDSYSNDDVSIDYYVDADTYEYTITTEVEFEEMSYTFICKIETEYYQVTSLTYE